ncbi:MAG: epimerase [Paracoccaceae bacterium]|jgi:nucleoside-diphosphate-sugar epimerase
MTQTILILGATGRIGRNGVIAFGRAGWNVRTFDRKHDNLMEKAKGVDVILNGWNPAYTDWAKQLPILTEQVIAAAKVSGATVMIPGNVYVFGNDAPQNFSEKTAHAAKNKLGRLRIEMETAFRNAGVQSIILRAGDFMDTEASGNWFDLIMTKKLAKGVFTYPGPLHLPHAWAYLPDLLRAFVELAEARKSLAKFEDVPFPGYTMTGQELTELVRSATGQPVKVKQMAWWPIRLISPFWGMGARLVEMSYLWRKPHHLDGTKFSRLLPEFKSTLLPVAIQSALSLDINPDQPMVGAKIAV